MVQLNEFETDRYFPQSFQYKAMLIHAFCEICKREIVFGLLSWAIFCFDFFRTISGSQLLQNMWIIKQTVVLLWKNLRKYGSVSYSFSLYSHDPENSQTFYARQSSTTQWSVKGQLISKCPFGVMVCTKIPTKFFPGFLPWPPKKLLLNQNNKGTLFTSLGDFILTLLHYFFDLTSF